LFILTERYRFCVLAFDTIKQAIVTKSNGELQDRIGRPAEAGQMAVIDPDCRVIGLHLYDGLFKVIPMDPTTGKLEEAFNIRYAPARRSSRLPLCVKGPELTSDVPTAWRSFV